MNGARKKKKKNDCYRKPSVSQYLYLQLLIVRLLIVPVYSCYLTINRSTTVVCKYGLNSARGNGQTDRMHSSETVYQVPGPS